MDLPMEADETKIAKVHIILNLKRFGFKSLSFVRVNPFWHQPSQETP
jgi:hypothetical protein